MTLQMRLWSMKVYSNNLGSRFGLILLTIVGLWLLAGGAPASAQSGGGGWEVLNQAIAPDGSSRMLWINPGTTDNNGNYSGDLVSVWTMNSAGTATAQGPVYGPYPGWEAQNLRVAPDGTTRLQWVIPGTTDNNGNDSGDTVSIWTLDAAGNEQAEGDAYGPYAGWTNQDFEVAPDNTVRLLWNNQGSTDSSGNYTGDIVSVWTVNASGIATAQGQTYGPYVGWNVSGYLDVAADSTTRLLWINQGTTDSNNSYTGDEASVWTLNAAGTATAQGPTYGPFTGWYANDFQIAPDNTTRLFWGNADTTDSSGNPIIDEVSFWTLDASGDEIAEGPGYGPYPGWVADYFEIAGDNTVRLLWTNPGSTDSSGNYTGDIVSLWSFNASGQALAKGTAYGPYVGWGVSDFEIAPDSTMRLLWTNPGTTDSSGDYTGDQASLWSLNKSGTATATGPAYGPYPGWRAEYSIPLTSSLTDLLWLHDQPGSAQNGSAPISDAFTIWTLGASNTKSSAGPIYGPYN